MRCNCSIEIKDCCSPRNCCEECNFTDCNGGCDIWSKTKSCRKCEHMQYVCDMCCRSMTSEEYFKNKGFCDLCGANIVNILNR